MPDFFYNLRKKINHLKRRNLRPAFHHFSEKMHYRRSFRLGFIIALSLIIFSVATFLLWKNGVFSKLGGWVPKHEDEQLTVLNPTPVPTNAPTPSPKPRPTKTTVPQPTEEATPQPTEELLLHATVKSNILNVRKGPSTEHEIVGRLYQGDEVEVLQFSPWCIVMYGDDYGYVSIDFLTFDGPTPTIAPTATPEPTPTAAPTLSPTPSPTPEPTPEQEIQGHWEHEDSDLQISIDKIKEDQATYYVAHIQAPATSFWAALASETAEIGAKAKPTILARDAGAILAINGDYCGYRDTGVIIRNGQLFRDNPSGEMAVLFDSGQLEMIDADEMTAKQMIAGGALQCWSFGPILVKNGVPYDNFRQTSALWKLNPRTGIGMVAPGHYIFIVVDGRQEASEGMTLDSFAALFASLSCQTAYNLDGGATSIMIFDGEIINNPSGTYQRETSDIICIK